MGNFEGIKNTINANIRNNGNQEITGNILNNVLMALTEEVEQNVEALQTEQESNNVAIEDLQDNKADRGGYEPDLSVGVADHLAGHDEPTPSEFTFRRSGGGAILSGNARVQSVKGNSVVWNQHLSIKTKLTYSNAAGSSYYSLLGLLPYYNTAINGRRIFAIAKDSKNQLKTIYFNDNLQRDLRGGYIFTANTTVSDNTSVFAEIEAGIAVNTDVEVFFYDLTQMFGAGNEPQTIDDFYSRIPQGIDMDAYNEGEVIHMNVDAVKSVGFNQWDEVWEQGQISQTDGSNVASDYHIRSKNFIKVMPRKTYMMVGTFRVIFYDAEKKFVDWWSVGNSREFTLPDNVFYVRLYADGPTYNHDICINISDTEKNGTYEPYISRMQSLEILRKYFPNGMRSAGTAHDEIRYNKATQKWEAVKRIGEVDLGTLNWNQIITGANILTWYATVMSDMLTNPSSALKANILCDRYTTETWNDLYYGNVAEGIAQESTYLRFASPNLTSKEDVQSALQGVILYYELANPIVTEIEEAFNLDYEVWNGGTEQAIADTPTSAFKADIIYGFNAYGVIKELREQLATLQAAIAKMNV